MFGTGIAGADMPEFFKKSFDAAPASVWDPAERLKEQDVDGIKSEVLFTSFGLIVLWARRRRFPEGLFSGLQ